MKEGTVYVAGSSAELERVERMAQALTELGYHIISTWTENVRREGAANPRDASYVQRLAVSEMCVEQVTKAEHFVFLVPRPESPTRGAWVEMGVRVGHQLGNIHVVGDTKQSIFSAYGIEYASDAELIIAFREMLEASRRSALLA